MTGTSERQRVNRIDHRTTAMTTKAHAQTPSFRNSSTVAGHAALSFASSHHPHAIPQTYCGTLRNGRYFVDGAPGQLTVLHHDPSSDYAVTDASVFPYHDIAKDPCDSGSGSLPNRSAMRA